MWVELFIFQTKNYCHYCIHMEKETSGFVLKIYSEDAFSVMPGPRWGIGTPYSIFGNTMTSALRHFDKHSCSEANTAHFNWLHLAVITLLQWITARVHIRLKEPLWSTLICLPRTRRRFVWSHVPFPEPDLHLVTWIVGTLQDEFTSCKTSLEPILSVSGCLP